MHTDHIEYRIQRANETYQDAIFLFEKGSLNSCSKEVIQDLLKPTKDYIDLLANLAQE